jgi:hypothetical protein
MACTPGTITVTNTDDNGLGSLRNAVASAGACPGSTVNFSVTGTITLQSRILINAPMTITGPGAQSLTVSGNHATRIFCVGSGTTAAFSGTVNINGLTLANGYGKGGDSPFGGGGGAGMGGAIFQNGGNLNVSGVVFSGNQAQGGASPSCCLSGGGGFGGDGLSTNGGSGGDLGGLGGQNAGSGGPGAGGGGQQVQGIGGAGGFGGGGGTGYNYLGGAGGFGGGGGADMEGPGGPGGYGGGSASETVEARARVLAARFLPTSIHSSEGVKQIV